MSKRTPSGATSTGHKSKVEGPVGGTKGDARFGDTESVTGGHTSDDSPAVGGRKTGPTGLDDMRKVAGDPTGIPFEEPERIKDGVRELGPVSEDES